MCARKRGENGNMWCDFVKKGVFWGDWRADRGIKVDYKRFDA